MFTEATSGHSVHREIFSIRRAASPVIQSPVQRARAGLDRGFALAGEVLG